MVHGRAWRKKVGALELSLRATVSEHCRDNSLRGKGRKPLHRLEHIATRMPKLHLFLTEKSNDHLYICIAPEIQPIPSDMLLKAGKSCR